jgi:hypothetical protein
MKRELPMSDQDVAMRIALASAFRDCGLPSDEQDVDDFLVALRSFANSMISLATIILMGLSLSVRFNARNVSSNAPTRTCTSSGLKASLCSRRRRIGMARAATV